MNAIVFNVIVTVIAVWYMVEVQSGKRQENVLYWLALGWVILVVVGFAYGFLIGLQGV